MKILSIKNQNKNVYSYSATRSIKNELAFAKKINIEDRYETKILQEVALRKYQKENLKKWKNSFFYQVANKPDKEGYTKLTKSIKQNQTKGAIKLIDGKYTDVNLIDNRGNIPLFLAIVEPDDNLFRALLEHKDVNGNIDCDINAKNNNGVSALMHAVHFDDIERIRLLLEHKDKDGNLDCDINAKDNNGNNALMYALRYNNIEAMKLLLVHENKDGNYDCDINAKDNNGNSTLIHAIRCKNIEAAKLLIDHKDKNGNPDCDVNIIDGEGCSALKNVIISGQREIGILLLNHKNKYGNFACDITPLRTWKDKTTELEYPYEPKDLEKALIDSIFRYHRK